MAQYTLTYSEGAKGWPSFYSFIPEWILAANNYLYTFQDGQLWRHNVNDNRANFYGAQFASSVQTVLNASPLETKVYKTIELIGTAGVGWGTVISSNLQSGYSTDYTEVQDDYPVSDKEGHMFSYILSPADNISTVSLGVLVPGGPDFIGTNRLAQRSIQMIGDWDASPGENYEFLGGVQGRVSFARNVVIPPMLSIGDTLIVKRTVDDASWFAGVVEAFGTNPDTTSTGCVIDGGGTCFGLPSVDIDLTGAANPPNFAAAGPGVFYQLWYMKNDQIESYGILGDYADVTLSINTPGAVELFSIQSEVMKSNP